MKTVKAMLLGGPAGLSEAERLHEVTDLDENVKISYRAGHEHFSHTGEFHRRDGEMLAVFAWCGRTKVAE